MNPAEQARQKIEQAPLDFRLALTFSPTPRRAALTALWAVYLEIREVIRECSDPGIAGVKLSWWEQEVDALYLSKPRHPLTQALAPYMDALLGKQQLFHDCISGARMDVSGAPLPSFEDVKRYCYRHSGALAELTAALGGARSKDSALAARLLGNSYRIACIVNAGTAEALRGRVYFAAEDLQKHAVDKHISGATHTDASVRALLKDYAERARGMQHEALTALPAAERPSLDSWRVLNALALQRVAKLERRRFSASPEPVELQPLAALFTAWRAARQAG